MNISVKTCFTALASLLIPGLGQLFRGEILWSFFWFASAIFFPVMALPAAVHCLFIE